MNNKHSLIGTLSYAIRYSTFGFEVFPCAPMRKVPFVGTDGFKSASSDREAIEAMWNARPNANIGLRTGVINGDKQLVVIDIDPRNFGDESLFLLTSRYSNLPDTASVLTSNGGTHLYFWAPANITFKSALAEGIDIKSKNGYVMAPPSVHPSGWVYEWEASSDLLEGFQIADLPEWVIFMAAKTDLSDQPLATERVCAIEDVTFNEIKSDLYDIPPSCNRSTWIKVLCALKSYCNSKQMFDLFDSWSSNCPEKYCKSVTRKTWDSFTNSKGITIKSLSWIAREERLKKVDLSAILNRKRAA